MSFLAHIAIVGAAVALPILYASEKLPEPPDMMAFVVDVPPPPPPPPPPAPVPAAPKQPQPAQPTQTLQVIEKPLPRMDTVAAPIEAPTSITPETAAAAPAIQAGFEGGVPGGIPGGVVGGAVGGVDSGAPPPPPPPAPKPVPQGPVRVGGQIKAPELVNRVNPTYPPAAQSAQVEGSVVLEANVDTSGRVQGVRVVKSHPLLEGAAISAVKQWRYQPLLLNDAPVPFILTVTLNFTMPR